ncbi:MAG TPA: helix-turn-helix transcriptional regulator [Candidatus Limiplasma sp.]|nr:helix-turn-helix transcriptional regulator [Candidatus Limiplasma sp.]HPR78319.1 helix-turn-helix transcriptional regulator [Candidatus Limiplasma sp.]
MKERIRKFRRQMKWTQADFATRMGVTRDVVASWENGRVEPPEAVIRLICREYDISYDWLKNGREPMVVPRDSLTLDKVDRILNGENALMKAVFREMADLPPEGWEILSRFVDRLYESNHAHDKPKQQS